MEMLPLVKVVPEMNLTLDPTTGMIGAALGRDVVIVSMDGVNEQLDVLEVAVEDLYTALIQLQCLKVLTLEGKVCTLPLVS